MGKKKKHGILDAQSAASKLKLAKQSTQTKKAAKRSGTDAQYVTKHPKTPAAIEDASYQNSNRLGAVRRQKSCKAQTVETTTPRNCTLSSPLQQQCAIIVFKLLHGVNQRRSSGSLKTLCLGEGVQVCGSSHYCSASHVETFY